MLLDLGNNSGFVCHYHYFPNNGWVDRTMGNETFSVRHGHGIYCGFGRTLSRGEGGVRIPPPAPYP